MRCAFGTHYFTASHRIARYSQRNRGTQRQRNTRRKAPVWLKNCTPLRLLIAARDKLVEERRGLSGAIALGYRRRGTDDAHTNDMRETFIGIQNTIEAIERAIAHEELLGRKIPQSLAVPTLVPLEDPPEGVSQAIAVMPDTDRWRVT